MSRLDDLGEILASYPSREEPSEKTKAALKWITGYLGPESEEPINRLSKNTKEVIANTFYALKNAERGVGELSEFSVNILKFANETPDLVETYVQAVENLVASVNKRKMNYEQA